MADLTSPREDCNDTESHEVKVPRTARARRVDEHRIWSSLSRVEAPVKYLRLSESQHLSRQNGSQSEGVLRWLTKGCKHNIQNPDQSLGFHRFDLSPSTWSTVSTCSLEEGSL